MADITHPRIYHLLVSCTTALFHEVYVLFYELEHPLQEIMRLAIKIL